MNESMKTLGENRSEIRELFEYGKELSKKGLCICDLTLGNPTAKTPEWVTETLKAGLALPHIHDYSSIQGSYIARKKMANSLSKYGVAFSAENIILTCGAASSLCAVFKALTNNEKDEIIALSPYFPEYKVYVEGVNAKFKTVGFYGDDFSPNLSQLEEKINENTRAIIINSPNNPSGKVFSKEQIGLIAEILKKKSTTYNNPIYIVSDEPYREIVFDKEKAVSIASIYPDTIICYSFSKSLSIPGERIGYIALPDRICAINDLYVALLGSLRTMGYVCAPSVFQYLLENYKEEFSDFSIYESNKNTLLSCLKKLGFTCNNPQGAFYLMVKAPNGNSKEFSEKAKKIGLLIVPADSFGAEGWLRIATCVSKETVALACSLFEKLV